MSANIIRTSFATLRISSRILSHPSRRHSHVSYLKRFSRALMLAPSSSYSLFPSSSRYIYRRIRVVDIYDARSITDRKCTQRKQRILRLLEALRTRKTPISPLFVHSRVPFFFFFTPKSCVSKPTMILRCLS